MSEWDDRRGDEETKHDLCPCHNCTAHRQQLTESNRQLREELESSQSYLGELSRRMPTTAQIMIWFSAKQALVKKLEYLIAECDEKVHTKAAKEALDLLNSKSMCHPATIDAGQSHRITALNSALAAAKEALQRIATQFPIDDGEEVKSLARHKCEQARDALARIAECEKGTI